MSDPAPVAERPLDRKTLRIRAGVDDETIDRLVALGIIHRRHDGGFREQDVTTVRLPRALETSGIALDDLGASLERGALPDFGRVLAEPIGLLPRSYGDLGDEIGLDHQLVGRIVETLGLPEIDPDAPVREDDAELLTVAAAVVDRAGLPEETLLRTPRIFAERLDRIAEHQRGLFRRDVQDRMLADGRSRAEMLAESAHLREFLVGCRTAPRT